MDNEIKNVNTSGLLNKPIVKEGYVAPIAMKQKVK